MLQASYSAAPSLPTVTFQQPEDQSKDSTNRGLMWGFFITAVVLGGALLVIEARRDKSLEKRHRQLRRKGVY